MKKAQKPQVLIKKKCTEDKDFKNTMQAAEKINIDYAALIQSLKRIQNKKVKKDIVTISLRKVPYKIPAIYSLESEMDAIALMKRRVNIIHKNICSTDMESFSLDWKRVGRDLNAAIYKYRRNYAGNDG